LFARRQLSSGGKADVSPRKSIDISAHHNIATHMQITQGAESML